MRRGKIEIRHRVICGRPSCSESMMTGAPTKRVAESLALCKGWNRVEGLWYCEKHTNEAFNKAYGKESA